MSSEYGQFESQADKCIAFLKDEYANIRAGRANPHILDKIKIEYYGTMTPITQIANVSVPEARTLMIQPWEAKVLSEIEKAIQKSDLGLNPTNDGRVIRIMFPQLTEERRKEIVKNLKSTAENARINIRNARRDAIDHFKSLEKKGELTKDALKGKENEIQKITDKKIQQIDDIFEKKEQEILEV